ncbi:FAD-dependent oxidoreductase [Candidatus Uabimicrobium sp. HlEnr_7]|uniref:FAD-dependent oxidoreductase n=1 Tax=Candidatus Uabimicrobium helgolandensis TaxID=3095367 RepID=UPI003558DE33
MSLVKDHAIILGAGMAGLLSAKVASQHFAKVTLIDKDLFPTDVCPRKGVPQAVHLHVLLQRGLFILNELFSGIENDLVAKGAVQIDWAKDSLWMNPFGWIPRFDSDLIAYTCSRWMLEHTVRERVMAIRNITICPQTEWKDFIIDAQNEICGVVVEVNKEEQQIHGDLVIDTTGKNSKTIKTLEQHGFPAPPESRINSYLGYGSRHYRIPDGNRDWKQLYIQMKPPQSFRGGVLQPIEGNRWIATLIGANKDYPPADEEAFLSFAKSLRSPNFYEAIRNAEPLSKVYCYRNTESRLRHFHKMAKIPIGLVCIGDSVCAFNPVYGQGMTVSAISAQILDSCLNKTSISRSQFSRTFYKKLSKVNSMPWLIANSEDSRILSSSGQKMSFSYKLIHSFLDRVLYSATLQPNIHKSFLKILHMTEPMYSLANPKILLSLRKSRD